MTVFTDDSIALVRRLQERGVFVVPIRGAVRIALCSVATRDVERLIDALATRRPHARSAASLEMCISS